MEVSLAASALEDLADIQRYYADQGVPDVGPRLTAELLAHIEHLATHPNIGRIVPEFNTPSLRELIHPPFRIVYWRGRGRINIVRIWRSERLLRLPEK